MEKKYIHNLKQQILILNSKAEAIKIGVDIIKKEKDKIPETIFNKIIDNFVIKWNKYLNKIDSLEDELKDREFWGPKNEYSN